jgi:hypothetical protein
MLLFSQNSDESWKLYDDTNVARIDITIDPAKLAWIYANSYSDSEHVASIHYKNNWIDETVDSVGFRLRGNTSRDARKKSFKLSFNSFIQGREFYDVDKLNLNGEHNDPSIVRSKLCFDLYNKIGMKASRASYAAVYINGKYYGLYISVEHVDNEFIKKNFSDFSGNLWKCLYPADLVYIGLNPDVYKFSSGGRRAYDLITNEDQDDYSKLARLIDIINRTPSGSFPDSLEKVLDVADVLKYFAINILVGGWDDYWSLKNNYYLYHSPVEDKFHWLPYDYDNTFGIDWFSIDWTSANPYNFPKVASGPRPLAEKLIANASYRNLYTHFIEFYREKVFKLNNWESRIDSIKNLIYSYAAADSFRTLDYGFTIYDFNQSYNASPYSNQHVKNGLKQFINFRYNSLPAQLNYVNSPPVIYALDYYPQNPSANDSIYVIVSAFCNSGLSGINIEFTQEGISTPQQIPMFFNPLTNTTNVDEYDRWIGVIPPLGAGKSGNFKIVAASVNHLSSIFPRHTTIKIGTHQLSPLVINEFMAENDNIIQDNAGEYDDWIELYNSSSNDILLSGMYLSDRADNLTKWVIPGDSIKIHAGEYLLIWCDEDQQQGDLHSNFALSAGGEFIALTSPDGFTVVDSVSFGAQTVDVSFGRIPDGTGNFQFLNSPTPAGPNVVTDISGFEPVPSTFDLTAYPNPFNPSTKIRLKVPSLVQNIFVTLKIYDIIGNEVDVLLNENKSPGTYEVIWNAGKNSSGVYFFVLTAGNFSITKKLMLLK